MKSTILIAAISLAIASMDAHALALNPGESFEFSFQSSQLIHSSNSSSIHEAIVEWDITEGNVGDYFNISIFEGIDFSSPLQSYNASVGPGAVGIISQPNSLNIPWQDMNGAIRFTAGATPLELNAFNITISNPTNLHSIRVLPQEVPEASILLQICIGLPLMAFAFFRRKMC